MTQATDLEKLALELIEIPSVIGNEAAIADFVEARAKRFDPFRLERAGENIAIVPHAFREGKPRLMLLGHLDTVPVSDANPARVDDERIYGLGSSDMKAADAVMFALAERAATEPGAVDLVVVLYAREEGPYHESGMPEIVDAAPDLFENVDLAIAMEPTDNHIELGCMGSMHAWVHVHGTRAHSARPWQGKNAIHAAAPLLSALEGLEPRVVTQDDMTFTEVASATMCRYDGARNVIPGGFSLNINLRFAPDRSMDEARQWIHNFVAVHMGADAESSGLVTIEVTDLCPSGRVCGTNPLLAQLEAASGPATTRRAKQAWTDVGRLSHMGMDAINYGPGSGAQAHQVGEWCNRAQLAASYEALLRAFWR